jgi:hypothetical protein
MKVNARDMQAVVKAHRVNKKPEFYYKGKRSSPQYSARFIEWILAQYERDQEFFTKARNRAFGGR